MTFEERLKDLDPVYTSIELKKYHVDHEDGQWQFSASRIDGMMVGRFTMYGCANTPLEALNKAIENLEAEKKYNK